MNIINRKSKNVLDCGCLHILTPEKFESKSRESQWLKEGCNSPQDTERTAEFGLKRAPQSWCRVVTVKEAIREK